MLVDRISQKKFRHDSKTSILPQRFQLEKAVLVNGHTGCNAGSILFTDGNIKLKVDNFELQSLTVDVDSKYEIVDMALCQIVDKLDLMSPKLPSPLLPASIFTEEGNLSELEVLLKDVLAKGHLHEVSHRPRLDIRYEVAVLPIGRAKKLANSAERHLAANSDCWNSRTIVGIQPKRIQALISEDEYNLYENRVFARLVDRLERYITRRIIEVKLLVENLTDALNLEDSDAIDFRLSRALFSIWGETYSAEQAQSALDSLNETTRILKNILKTINGFKQQLAYKSVPRNAQVPGGIEITNILGHDQHYRHIPKLWNTLRIVNHKLSLSPKEQAEANIRRQQAYCGYVGLVLTRALLNLKFNLNNKSNNKFLAVRDGLEINFEYEDTAWLIKSKQIDQVLRLVPIYSYECDGLFVSRSPDQISIPCCLGGESENFDSSGLISGESDNSLFLSPIDFLVEEKIISLLNSWIYFTAVRNYGKEITQVPSRVMNLVQNQKSIEVTSDRSFRLTSLPDANLLKKIESAIKKENAVARIDELNMSVLAVQSISKCPVCQSAGDFLPRDNACFVSQCQNNDCRLIWEIIPSAKGRTFISKIAEYESTSFKYSGRWSMMFNMN